MRTFDWNHWPFLPFPSSSLGTDDWWHLSSEKVHLGRSHLLSNWAPTEKQPGSIQNAAALWLSWQSTDKDIFGFPGTKIGRDRSQEDDQGKYVCWKWTSLDTYILRLNWVARTSCLRSSGFSSLSLLSDPCYPGYQVTRILLPSDTNPVFRRGIYMCL